MMEEKPQFEIGEEASDLLSQIRGLLEYKFQIIGIVVISVLVTAVVVYSKEPIYRATSSLYIEPRQQTMVNMQDIYDSGAGTQSHYGTQLMVLASRDLAEKAVDRIDWSQYPEYMPAPNHEPNWLAKLDNRFPVVRQYAPFLAPLIDRFAVTGTEQGPLTEEQVRQFLIGVFMGSTQVEPVAMTQIIRIHFLSPNRQLASEAANVLANVYIQSGLEAQFEATQRATEWMESRLEGVRGSLADSEARLQEFREAENLVNIRGGRGVLEDELTDNMQRLRDAQRTMTQLQNTYESIQRARGDTYALQQIPVLLDKELVRSTKRSFLAAQENLSELRSRYGPRHPRIINARARLEETRDAFDAQLRNAAEGVRSEYEIAAQNVRGLSATVEKTREDIQKIDRQEHRMQILQRNADATGGLYDTILTRFKTADMAGDYEALRARMVDPAIVPNRPYLPRKRRALMLAAFFGFLGGVGLALIRQYLDNSIKTGDELESVGRAPVFASIPSVSKGVFGGGTVPRLVMNKPHTAFAEGIRTIRTGVILSDLDHKRKRLLVTSALPEEGKSSLACNLALAFGEMERVLLVEGDLRKPNLSRYLDLKGKLPGLGELLAGSVEKAQALYKIADKVDFLPVGKVVPGSGELLTSERFQLVMAELVKDYDRVIFDSSPCQPVSDTLLLAKHTDGVIFVVRYDSTGVKTVQQTLKRLRQSRVPVLGMVLNRVNARRAVKSGDGYYYGYYG